MKIHCLKKRVLSPEKSLITKRPHNERARIVEKMIKSNRLKKEGIAIFAAA